MGKCVEGKLQVKCHDCGSGVRAGPFLVPFLVPQCKSARNQWKSVVPFPPLREFLRTIRGKLDRSLKGVNI